MLRGKVLSAYFCRDIFQQCTKIEDEMHQICLYKEGVTDLQQSLENAKQIDCDTIVATIINPAYKRYYGVDSLLENSVLPLTRSDLSLSPDTWKYNIICKISDEIDCDSIDDNIRAFSQSFLERQLSYVQYIAQENRFLIAIRSKNTANLAHVISNSLKKGKLLIEIPMMNRKIESSEWRQESDSVAGTSEDTWHWWNTFRTYTDYHPNILLALELTNKLPNFADLLRWMGEPIDLLIISTSLFGGKERIPVLSVEHTDLVVKFLAKTNCQLALKPEGGSYQDYADYIEYMNYLNETCANENSLWNSYSDILKEPLQPLQDNLCTEIYEMFEEDPVKYLYYQRAIACALHDVISDEDRQRKTATVMVVGAGRGPLVRCVINAADNTMRRIKLIVVEKNPNAIVTLMSLQEEMWSDKDMTIISTDMRNFSSPAKADIMVSELLGSFGDNELSPECLDGAQIHLKDNGISIPCRSTSFINPVTNMKLTKQISYVRGRSAQNPPINYETISETSYVAHLQNNYHIDKPKSVFTFVHPNRDKPIDNTRYQKLEFDVPNDCVLTGFGGYFEAMLYNGIDISIHPLEHTAGLISWFSMYFPLSAPQHLRAGDKIAVDFWRKECVTAVWYEWQTKVPHLSHIHNLNGHAQKIHK